MNMKNLQRWLGSGCLALALLAGTGSALKAEDWMFARSYFSHADSPGYRYGIAPQAESAYRRPYRAPGPRGHIRGGFRINNIRIWNGSNNDIQYDREAWFDVQ
jgi:hypothetical protein